jgi:peptide/nickel transport system substrate-binding protein
MTPNLRWFLAPILLLAGLPGCSPSSGPAANTLIYARGGEAERLDPIHISSGESVKVVNNLFDTLVTFADESTQIVPCLAERWQTSADGRTWTFELRANVKFHDGTPLDAQAVVFTFQRLIEAKHPHVYYDVIPYAPDYQDIVRVRSAGPLTVVFELREPSAVFLANLTMFPASIVSPAAVKKLGKRFGDAPVGTGPFRFVRWTRDQELVLAAFDHWRGRPQLDHLIFVPVVEGAVRAEQLERGEVHLVDDLPPSEFAALAERPDLVVQRQLGMNVGYLTMQTEKPPLNLLKVREAIALAIDKRRLIDVAYSGQGQAAVSILPPSMWAWHDGLVDRPHDIQRAKALLAEAQREGGFALPLKLDLFVMKGARPYMQQPQETAIFIKQSLQPIGIEARIVINEMSLHIQRLSRGEHQLGLIGWTTDNCDPDNFLYPLLDSDNINDTGGNNNSRYRNAEFHALLFDARRELDRERRKQLYRRAQELVFRDVPVLPLVHTDVRVAQRRELVGYKLHPSAAVWLREARFQPARP